MTLQVIKNDSFLKGCVSFILWLSKLFETKIRNKNIVHNHVQASKWNAFNINAGAHQSFVADVSSPPDITNLFKWIKDSFPGIAPSIVVCCAGTLTQGKILDYDVEEMDKQFAVDFKVT